VTDFPIMTIQWWIAGAVLLLALVLGLLVGRRLRARYG
jgi:hypothetical protein